MTQTSTTTTKTMGRKRTVEDSTLLFPCKRLCNSRCADELKSLRDVQPQYFPNQVLKRKREEPMIAFDEETEELKKRRMDVEEDDKHLTSTQLSHVTCQLTLEEEIPEIDYSSQHDLVSTEPDQQVDSVAEIRPLCTGNVLNNLSTFVVSPTVVKWMESPQRWVIPTIFEEPCHGAIVPYVDSSEAVQQALDTFKEQHARMKIQTED
eukprot:TRINITY_DN1787_c0_g5_i2.p1 TRINITY_DN1787_c0_g5~~TRINITY_DN1787_c0_g5_i2.p1  ORF type:complete len:207 (-),score=51.47 TRINITY_DN1787_c0_g5_i2:201-821(-)